ncbi:hypothetical protein C2I18_21360 [Paenibacillus sp. PK3_47]|uniref:hypothetical protein n=1 Tax=Paenibacillus sp. PK3_47 TaxID=2072642 RepID=UPI00201E3931|nr:hypothetical protein [Paenibacillus sp. PK3_47]UQZ35854.1 hypothetical protein C2I18_21360 [Paenibacillus sp. PK3_47]
MRHNRSLPAVAAVAVLMLTLTACGGSTPADAPGEPSATVAPSPVESMSPPSPSPAAAEEAQVISGSGTYVGQIDNHSIEITTEEGPTAFELGTVSDSVLEGLEMDDPVVFEYVEKAVEGDPLVFQRVLSKLAKEDNAAGAAPVNDSLPATKNIKLTLEGMEEEKTAALVQGEGYALYMFDFFTFDASENKLSVNADPDYYAEITKLPSDFNLDALEEEGRQELAATGEVTALSQEEQDVRLSGSRLFLTAMGQGMTREYIVKEVDGQGYIVKLNIPQREASEGFWPHVYAMLDSMVNR